MGPVRAFHTGHLGASWSQPMGRTLGRVGTLSTPLILRFRIAFGSHDEASVWPRLACIPPLGLGLAQFR